jgi:MYXO-CTERM domain-containing protein
MSKQDTAAKRFIMQSSIIGPYVDGGTAYTDSSGKGHNVTAALLPDGKYAIITSDTRPGAIFLADAITGPFAYQGDITVNANGFDASGTTKNLSLTILPDKSFLMATRFGAIMTTPTSLLGPWVVQGPRVFTTPSGYPSGSREDPVIWCSGGQFHLVCKARHMTSADGIKNWKDVGLAYDPTSNFVRYTDGTVNHWYKMERAGVYMENGHVVAFTFAVIDVDKTLDLANDTHGIKVIVVPFDGVTFDADTGIAGSTVCSSYGANSGVPSSGTGGSIATGGSTGTGGSGGAGGATAADASTNRDGTIASDTGSTGGVVGSGGTGGSAGAPGSGGATGRDASVGAGGAIGTGGASRNDAGNTTNTGGSAGSVAATGGAVAVGSGGTLAGGTGGSAGSVATSGGASGGNVGSGTGGSSIASGGAGGGGGQNGTGVSGATSPSGCSCAMGAASGRVPVGSLLGLLAALGLALNLRRRRRPNQ